jgi:hypothetical protein
MSVVRRLAAWVLGALALSIAGLAVGVAAAPSLGSGAPPITVTPAVQDVAPPVAPTRPGPPAARTTRAPWATVAAREPGHPLAAVGSTGQRVRDLQARLRQLEWFLGSPTGTYDATTAKAVRGFQTKRGLPVTGTIDARTLARLRAMTSEPTRDAMGLFNVPGPLDSRCRVGRVLCVDKSSQTLRWVVDGAVLMTVDVRFGGPATPTREGEFSVDFKSRDHVSTLYDTAMPFAMFFSGGQAVHYSPDFAAVGYAGASHGCVNVRDYDGVAWLFDQVVVGDKVIVYWS